MTRLLFLFFFVCLGATGGMLSPDFYIEAIRIVGARPGSEPLILAESRLKQDETYSETRLREAVQRINRLPFILETDFALEKGASRGKYRLVITVREASRLFFNLETLYIDEEFTRGYRDDLDVGARMFVGSAGLLFAGISPNINWLDEGERPTIYSLGYSNYNLFKGNVFLNVTLNYVEDQDFSYEGTSFIARTESQYGPWIPRASVAIPLGGNDWIKSTFSFQESCTLIEYNSLSPFLPERSEQFSKRRLLRSFWERNTLNDHFLPTQGALKQAGVYWLSLDNYRNDDGEPLTFKEDTDRLFGFFTYRRHYRFRAAHSFNWGITGAIGPEYRKYQSMTVTGERFEQNDDNRDGFGELNAGYSWDVWGLERTRRFGDLRLLAEASVGTGNNEIVVDGRELAAYGLNTSLVFRNPWGVVRLQVNFREFD